MSRRRGKSLAPSLFPFLAVLVCTLGTLILLLALVAQNATAAAEQQARRETLAETKDAKDQPPRLSAETVDGMLREEQFRVEQLVAFRDQQTADLGERRDELTYLEDQMDRLRKKLKAISDEVERATGSEATQEVDEQSLAELRRRIQQEREAVEQLERESTNNSPRVVIVPHKGPNGTDRRPIYLECSREGVTVWPEGSQISMSELQESAYSANPLDAALRTVRLHALNTYGDPVSPYPLLLVRPDGIEAYAAARRAMDDWDDQFGYELVPSDVKLAYGNSDPELKRRVDVAIRNAAQQQSAHRSVASQLGAGGHSSSGGSFSGSSFSGGRRSGRLPVLSAAQLDRQGRTNGFSSLPDVRSPAGRRAPMTPYSNGTVGSGVGNSPYSSGGTYDQGHSGSGDEVAASARRLAQQMRTAAKEMREDGSSDESANSGENTSLQENTIGDSNFGADDGPATKLAGSPQAGQSTKRSGNRNGSSAAPTTQQNRASPGGSSSAMSSASAMPSNQQAASASQSNSNSAPPTDLVRREGRDWALPQRMAGMRGGEVVRSLRAECYTDRFVLPGSGDGPTEIFGLAGEDVDSATLRLATALRDRIDRWGPALPGARWRPRLEVLVQPGAEMRFHQLRTLMTGSGIEVVGRAAP